MLLPLSGEERKWRVQLPLYIAIVRARNGTYEEFSRLAVANVRSPQKMDFGHFPKVEPIAPSHCPTELTIG